MESLDNSTLEDKDIDLEEKLRSLSPPKLSKKGDLPEDDRRKI
jgi:hypothetical protein